MANNATLVLPFKTQGIKYAGSKLKLLPNILELIQTVSPKTVFDGFTGTTRVAQALAQQGYQVTTNDVAVWSKVFATCYLKNRKSANQYSELIAHLNAISPKSGWFTKHYGGIPTKSGAIQTDGLKRPWQRHNTRKLDAIRDEIDSLGLSQVERAIAITSLILALDKVDNTIGHFVSYLKDWSPRSFQKMKLEVPQLFKNSKNHRVLCGGVFQNAPKVECDLAYLDPPYGSNNEKMPPSRVRYASYYHVWTTICHNDQPELVGKAKRRADCSDTIAASAFEDFRRNELTGKFKAVEAIERLIHNVNAKWVLLSYSSGGRATAKELKEVLESCGRVLEIRKIDYQRNVMAAMRWTDAWIRKDEKDNQEFLFLLEKN